MLISLAPDTIKGHATAWGHVGVGEPLCLWSHVDLWPMLPSRAMVTSEPRLLMRTMSRSFLPLKY